MAISKELKYAKLDELYLDAKNPRLGRHDSEGDLSQEDILGLMHSWVLDELAVSYLDSGFWTHEALLVVEEILYGQPHLVVVEGNRRLAALRYLYAALHGEQVAGKRLSKKWSSLVEDGDVPAELFNQIPYIRVDSREDVESFLGFRHVTGIKQWRTEQKAQYIAKLIEQGMRYEQVMRKIGSKTPTVQRHYISYQLLLQMENSLEDFSFADARGRFSVMSLSLRTQGVQTYLDIDILADEQAAKTPVPKTHLDALADFALWLFGNRNGPEKRSPLFTDSRRVNDFGTILEDSVAVKYLKEDTNPDFEYAFQLAGGDKSNIVQRLTEAANNVELVLSRVQHYKDSEDIQKEIKRLGIDVETLLNVFPSIRQELQEREEEN